MRTKHLMILAIVLAAVLILPVGAKACWITITATNGTITSPTVLYTDETLNGGFDYTSDETKQISLSGIGFIEKLQFSGKADPEIGVEFGVRAGGSATTFTISSGLETFAALTDPAAYASAGITLTDRAPPTGATLIGLFTDGKANQALYNNGATVFANLVSGFGMPSGQTTQTKDEEKGNEVSMITINDTLTSIESNFYFSLSAKDSAAGTSTFVVVPEPATMALLGLGALSLIRRKK
jgi:hypothetical protein